jgi:Tetratricopeptide repeat
MMNLADGFTSLGKYAQAEALDTQTLEIMRRVTGPEQDNTLLTMNNLAGVYANQGKYGQAEALYSQTLETCRRIEDQRILSRSPSPRTLHPCTNGRGNTPWPKNTLRRRLLASGRPLGRNTRTR